MASLRIKFPDKDAPRAITLTGQRITIGRLPGNTVQIIDRTLSGHHAEFIPEEGIYRLRDVGSTNGTFVNGQPTVDYHLREACQIAFGTVECDFSPEDAPGDIGETLPSHAEVKTVRDENTRLKTSIATLTQEIDSLRQACSAAGDHAAASALQQELEKLAVERVSLKETELRLTQEVARLQNELAILRRDRENLQQAWDASKAELEAIRNQLTSAVEPSAPVITTHKTFADATAPTVKAALPSARPAPQPVATLIRPFPRAKTGTLGGPTTPPTASSPPTPGSPINPGLKPRLPVARQTSPRPAGPRGTQKLEG